MVEVYFKNGTSAMFNSYDDYKDWCNAYKGSDKIECVEEMNKAVTSQPTSKYKVGDVLLIDDYITSKSFVAIVEEVIFSKKGVRYNITNKPNSGTDKKNIIVNHYSEYEDDDDKSFPVYTILGKVGNVNKIEYVDKD